MLMLSDSKAPEGVLHWAWNGSRTDILGWVNGWPMYHPPNFYETMFNEIGQRAAESLYIENDERWYQAMRGW